jgi:hypothetical protein
MEREIEYALRGSLTLTDSSPKTVKRAIVFSASFRRDRLYDLLP